MAKFLLNHREWSCRSPLKAGKDGRSQAPSQGGRYAKTRAEKRLQLPVPPGSLEIRTGTFVVNE